MLYFFDTSALVKRYHYETGTEIIQEIAVGKDNRIFISAFTIVELLAVVDKLLRRKIISREEVTKITTGLQDDLRSQCIEIINILPKHISKTYGLIFDFHLSSSDSLILACAFDLRDSSPIFVSADKNLLEVAQKNHLAILNPEH